MAGASTTRDTSASSTPTAAAGDFQSVEGLLPAVHAGAFDHAGRGGAGIGGLAGLGGTLAGAFVFDVGDREPDQLDHNLRRRHSACDGMSPIDYEHFIAEARRAEAA